MTIVLWVILPYMSLTLLIGGMIWRWRSDQFGWTTRSSQLRERRILSWASPVFHFGIIFALLGHIAGLLIPKAWTEALGIPNELWHWVATIAGTIAGIAALAGIAGLLYRRFALHSIRVVTTRNDVVMYVLLAIPIVLGCLATVMHQFLGGGYDYRETVSPWLRSVLMFQPRTELMVSAPLDYQLHVVAAFLLFAIWPFTRLVHVVSVPLGYFTRPAIVYRARTAATSSGQFARGWEPVDQAGAESGEARSSGA